MQFSIQKSLLDEMFIRRTVGLSQQLDNEQAAVVACVN